MKRTACKSSAAKTSLLAFIAEMPLSTIRSSIYQEPNKIAWCFIST
ncbi:MAG: hypothetical protein WCR04_02100 [Fibrobacteraceae bacterium]